MRGVFTSRVVDALATNAIALSKMWQGCPISRRINFMKTARYVLK
ncbi:hypothetical protein Z947_2965 [Sulfitobacter geojensis]|nr:hypothetical protein Z947_2965 [Sulfitobacter geojensis]